MSKLLESNKIKTKTNLRQRNEKREKNVHLVATHTMSCNLFENIFLFLRPFHELFMMMLKPKGQLKSE